MKPAFRFSMVIAVLLVSGMLTGAQAQKLFFVFAHGVYASPVQSDFKNNYSYGLGAEGGVGLGTGKTFFTGTVGYTFFNARPEATGNLTYAPMKLGVRRYFLPGNLLFIHADGGVANIKVKGGSSYSRLTGDVGAGAKLGPLDVGVAYNAFAGDDHASWLEFKVGWKFGL